MSMDWRGCCVRARHATTALADAVGDALPERAKPTYEGCRGLARVYAAVFSLHCARTWAALLVLGTRAAKVAADGACIALESVDARAPGAVPGLRTLLACARNAARPIVHAQPQVQAEPGTIRPTPVAPPSWGEAATTRTVVSAAALPSRFAIPNLALPALSSAAASDT